MRGRGRVVVLAAVVFLAGFFAWEWYLSSEARVRRLLSRAAEAAERKDAPELLGCFSSAFTSDRQLDYETLSERLERGFAQVDRLNVSLDDVRADVGSEGASATFDLTVVGIRGQERYLLVGGPMQPEKLRAELVREDGDWKIRRVEKAAPPP